MKTAAFFFSVLKNQKKIWISPMKDNSYWLQNTLFDLKKLICAGLFFGQQKTQPTILTFSIHTGALVYKSPESIFVASKYAGAHARKHIHLCLVTYFYVWLCRLTILLSISHIFTL